MPRLRLRQRHGPASSCARLQLQYLYSVLCTHAPESFFGSRCAAYRLIHRHTLAPSQIVTVHAKLWATRPGSFALDSWTVESEVGEPALEGSSQASWRSRHLRYVQSPRAGDRPSVTVVDTGRFA